MQPEISAKLEKANEFLLMAEYALAGDCFDAAVSLAASAAINGSDIVCLEVIGRYSSGKGHDEAFSLLRKCGVIGSAVSNHLRKALKVKKKAQYSSARCREEEAKATYMQAERLINAVNTWIKQVDR